MSENNLNARINPATLRALKEHCQKRGETKITTIRFTTVDEYTIEYIVNMALVQYLMKCGYSHLSAQLYED